MALKPPPLGDILQQMNGLAQSALGKLEMVSREEFDAQAAILARTRARVADLEAELEGLTREFEARQANN
ncbi:accessory factor UbiK family protein [Haliea sp. E1-2-M8]|uniref:accessory factor UbiK family protein n=1 Tax=Haliea sp. E1-2-M8 TaxID=3064706 RepID=UPI00271B7CB1|nr:accessory factor UbiK family protein [Haliea sp. E1-2-M8]MDO8861806.1 accessory factor UbiK family protein [Haliea sp. E1-2-M8]